MKKLKRKLMKKLENIKQYLRDQKYYLKETAIKALRSAANVSVLTVKILLVSLTLIISTIGANIAHMRYLEHKVGSNVLFARSLPDSPRQASGTAFEMKAKSGKVYTVTNAHICQLRNADNQIGIVDKNTGRLIPKRIIEVYPDNDLCIVEGMEGYDGLEMADELEVGDTVITIGYPLGEAMNIAKGRVKNFGEAQLLFELKPGQACEGPRLKKERVQVWFFVFDLCLQSHKAVFTDLVIYGGNSGSPMVNVYGNVVGVIFAGNQRTNWGIAVPMTDLQKLLEAY